MQGEVLTVVSIRWRLGLAQRGVKYKLIRLDGARFDAEVAASRCSHGGKPAVQLVVRSVAVRRRIEHHLSYLAQYDLLIRLPNRTQFRDRLVGTIARASRNKQVAAREYLYG